MPIDLESFLQRLQESAIDDDGATDELLSELAQITSDPYIQSTDGDVGSLIANTLRSIRNQPQKQETRNSRRFLNNLAIAINADDRSTAIVNAYRLGLATAMRIQNGSDDTDLLIKRMRAQGRSQDQLDTVNFARQSLRTYACHMARGWCDQDTENVLLIGDLVLLAKAKIGSSPVSDIAEKHWPDDDKTIRSSIRPITSDEKFKYVSKQSRPKRSTREKAEKLIEIILSDDR